MNLSQTPVTKSDENNHLIKAHLFSQFKPESFFRLCPGNDSTLNGVIFSVGLEIPKDIDVLILVGRGSYSIPTNLPRERTVFCEVEADAVNPRNTRFLNQFGIVITSSEEELKSEKWQQNNFNGWFVGVDFSSQEIKYEKNHDWFANLKPTNKIEKISIVTSNKNKKKRPFYGMRLQFIEELKNLIPEHLELYGRGFRPVGDKAEILLPYKYHLALENCIGRFTWTEKVADPLLCWSFPFYFGCTNLEVDIPPDSFEYVDLQNPKGSAEKMVNAIQNQLWEKSLPAIEEARNLILKEFNIMFRFSEVAKIVMDRPVAEWPKNPRLIRSDRSLRPDGISKGTVFDWLLRSSLIMIDPKIELRFSRLWHMNEHRKSRKNKP